MGIARFTSPMTGGLSKSADDDQWKGDVSGIRCVKCGEKIPPGKEVRKGFIRKKSYHQECAP